MAQFVFFSNIITVREETAQVTSEKKPKRPPSFHYHTDMQFSSYFRLHALLGLFAKMSPTSFLSDSVECKTGMAVFHASSLPYSCPYETQRERESMRTSQ